MGIITKQVWEIALFIMKIIYTCPHTELDMLPHCHLENTQGSFSFFSPNSGGGFFPPFPHTL